MKKLLSILSFLCMIKLQGYSCDRHNQSPFFHVLQRLDSKIRLACPVSLPKNQVRLMVVPHSKDENAQFLMAAAYQATQGQEFDMVILVSQTNSVLFHGVALPLCIENIRLFEGLSPRVDLLENLSRLRLFFYYQTPFFNNQNFQWQLGLLDFYMKNIKIIPLIIGQISQKNASEIAAQLARYCSPQTLIILSADVAYHQNCYHTNPLDQSNICRVYDRDIDRIQAIQSGSMRQQVALFDEELVSPIFALLFELLKLPTFQNVASDFVGYATDSIDQSDVKFDRNESYAAFIFQHHQGGYKNNIGFYEQSQLLQSARCGLDSLFEVLIHRQPCMISYEMAQPHGIFSSLYRMSDHGTVLRGCMGSAQPQLPLHKMVYQMTKQAACKDLRFYPMRQKEIDNTIISLSVIVDLKKIDSYDQIQKSDGVMLQYDDKVAISLPSMMPIQNWSHESVLIKLSNQMGFDAFLWKKPQAKISTFKSLTFQEE